MNYKSQTKKQRFISFLKLYSIFGRRFGIFLENNTNFVDNNALIASFFSIISLFLILKFKLDLVTTLGSISFYNLKLTDTFFDSKNVVDPMGLVAQIDDKYVEQNTIQLFPLILFLKGDLSCENIQFKVSSFETYKDGRPAKPTNFNLMNCTKDMQNNIAVHTFHSDVQT